MRLFCLLILLCGLGSSSVFAQGLSQGLVLLYNFNGNTLDGSGNGIDSAPMGATPTADRLGNPNSAYQFDGVDDYIEIPYSPLVQIDPPVSFSFCINTESIDVDSLKFFHTDAVEVDYHGYKMHGTNENTGQIGLSHGCGIGGTTPSNRRSKISDSLITTNQWHHVVGIIRSGLDMEIYIDCINAGGYYTGIGPMVVAHSGSTGRIGSVLTTSWMPTTFYRGKIDQFAMWNRELSIGDIEKICNDDLEYVSVTESQDEVNSQIWYNSQQNQIKVRLYANSGKSSDRLQLFELNGKLIFEKSIINAEHSFPIGEIANGIYSFRIVVESGVKSGKILLGY